MISINAFNLSSNSSIRNLCRSRLSSWLARSSACRLSTSDIFFFQVSLYNYRVFDIAEARIITLLHPLQRGIDYRIARARYVTKAAIAAAHISQNSRFGD